MTTPTTTNATATTVNTDVNDVVKAAEQIAITAEETALDTAAPFFAVPVIKEITDEVLTLGTEYLGGKISVAVQQVGTFVVIDTQVSSEKSGISAALATLMLAEKSGNAQAIQEAIAAYAKAQSALINSDGSATAHT